MVDALITLIFQLLAFLVFMFLFLLVLGFVFPLAKVARRLYVRLLWRAVLGICRYLWRPKFVRQGGAHTIPDHGSQEDRR